MYRYLLCYQIGVKGGGWANGHTFVSLPALTEECLNDQSEVLMGFYYKDNPIGSALSLTWTSVAKLDA